MIPPESSSRPSRYRVVWRLNRFVDWDAQLSVTQWGEALTVKSLEPVGPIASRRALDMLFAAGLTAAAVATIGWVSALAWMAIKAAMWLWT
jgi:hypothetical protein